MAQRSPSPRVCCLGLDGTPHSLLRRMIDDGIMPNVAALLGEGAMRRMTSMYPWVSSVAWTTIQTGVNPARHGIFGFVDRDPQTLKTYIPLANRIRTPSVWDTLGDSGKRVLVFNVPVTYPAPAVNGILAAGFLAPALNDRAVFPASYRATLDRQGYRIDTDPLIARQSRDRALDDIRDALAKRCHTFLYLLDNEPWDFFLGVIMETDRLQHFFWEQMEQHDPVYAPAFFDIYRTIDAFIGAVRDRLRADDTLLMMSDHGFCGIKQEVFYNHWLARSGNLHYAATPPRSLDQIAPNTIAYSLDPGRIFLNLRGRERDGRVHPDDYERVRDEIIAAAEALRDPASGEQIVRRAYRREELYDGPLLEQAADIILAPVDGYDPKGALFKDTLTQKDTMMVGMHTYDDAFLYVGGATPSDAPASVLDIAPTILRCFGRQPPSTYDGHSVL